MYITINYLSSCPQANCSKYYQLFLQNIDSQILAHITVPSRAVSHGLGFPGGSGVKNPPANAGTQVWSLGWKDPLEKEITTHTGILAWGIPWSEEPGRLYIVHAVTKSQTGLRDQTTKTTSEALGKCFHICYFFNEGYICVFLFLILFPFFAGIASQ